MRNPPQGTAASPNGGDYLWLDGDSSKYVKIPFTDSLNISGEITIASWVYRVDDASDWRNLYNIPGSHLLEFSPSGGFDFRAENNNTDFNANGPVIPRDQWTHLAVTSRKVDESRFIQDIYINGEKVTSEQPAWQLPKLENSSGVRSSGEDLYLGILKSQDPWNPDPWTGGIDDFQVWDRALSNDEIRQFTYQGQVTTNSDLKGRYEFDNGTSVQIVDTSGNGNNGILHSNNFPPQGNPLDVVFDTTNPSEGERLRSISSLAGIASPGSNIFYRYYGEGISKDDFIDYGRNFWGFNGGIATVDSDGNLAIENIIKSDAKAEGDEDLHLAIFSDSGMTNVLGVSGPVTIRDTSNKESVVIGESIYTSVEGPTWTEAEANAQKIGGHLATFNSQTENEAVANSFNRYYAPYIGLLNQGSGWEWSSGESVSYSNWAPGTPNGGSSENYSMFYPQAGGVWDDFRNTDPWGQPGISETPIVTRGDSAYAIVQGPTWEEAEANAQKLGGHLVTINDQGEDAFVRDQVGQGYRWIGFTDFAVEGQFEWSSGENSSYTNWAESFDSIGWPHGGGQDYVLLNPHYLGKWDDLLNDVGASSTDIFGIAEIKLTGTTTPTNLNLNDTANTVEVSGAGSGTADGTPFSDIQSIHLKNGDDTATIGSAGSLSGLLNGGSGNDTLNANTSNNSVTINASGAGTVDGTSISNFETINTLAGNDSITVNNSSTALTLNTGEGTDSLTSTNTADTLNVSAANSGTLGSISFSNLENVTLGGGADTATIASGGALSSLLNLGNGNDVLTIEAGGTLHDIQGGEGDDVAIIKDGGIFDNLDLSTGSDNINFEGVPQFKAVSGGFSDGGIDSIGLGNGAEYLNYLGFAEGRLYLDKQAGLSAFDSNSINYDPTAIYVGDFENFDFAGGDDQLNLRFDDSDITGRSQYPELFDTNTLSFSGGEGYDTLNLDASATGLSEDAKQAIAGYQAGPAGNTLSVAFGGTNYNFADFEEVVVNGVSRGPTFRISLSPTGTVNEGSDLITTVQATNLAEGTEIYWSAGGENINSSDFDATGAGLSGTATVNANAQFLITHKIAADSNTEGDEILQIKLFSDSARTTQVGSTASVTINGDNNNPMVVNDTIAVTEDQAISFNPAANDTDPDQGDKVRVGAVSNPATNKGFLHLDGSGNEVTYTAINHFESLPKGGSAAETFSYTAVDNNGGSTPGTVTVNITGVNDAPVAVNDSIEVTEESNLIFNASNNDEDIDQGDSITTVSVSNPVGNKGTAILNAQGEIEYKTNGAFDELPAGVKATESFSYVVADKLGAIDQGQVNVTVQGLNDDATITANPIYRRSTTQNASNLKLTESEAIGFKSAEDVFSISDVDYGEQEFKTTSVTQSVAITADGKGAYQVGGDAVNRVVGSFALDASNSTNTVAAGATTGTTADLTITDNGTQNGAANGFNSLAEGETATASITLTSEDGTATSVSKVTITGINDSATINNTPYKTSYKQADFNSSPSITYAGAYQVADIDYGEQEFSSGNYSTSITVDSAGGRNGQSVGSFSIISDGSNHISSGIYRDAGSQNSDSADVVISSDSKTQVGQVFNLATVLDTDPSNNYGVTINGGIGINSIYDLSDLSTSSAGHGQIEVYRYQTNGDGSIVGGGWSATDNNKLSATDPLRLIGGINSLAYGETATSTLVGVSSEDGGATTGPTTVTISGANDAPVIDTTKQLKSFELQGTFTVAEMLGFADPSKTLITDVDYGSMPESIAVTKLSPAGNFADAETGTLQRYNEKTKDWDDIDTKNVSDSNKLLLRPNDLLRFNATAEAYVSAALGDGSSNGGAIYAVEFRAWDSAYEAALEKNNASPAANDKSLFSSDLQTINLAIASTGERANETDLTYIPGQAIGIDGSNITVDGELNIQTPVKGSVAGASSSVNDNAVALVDGTSFGGIHGVGSQNNITSAGSSIINAQAEGLVAVDASNYFDSFDDAIDADATARLGIKSGPLGSGLVANGAYGIRDVDLQIGGNLDLTGEILGKTNATSRSMDGRAHAGSQFSSSAGIANTTADVAGDMTMAAEGGILTNVSSFSRNGSAISDNSATAAYGVVSGLKGSETSFDVGGAFNGEAGLNITMNSKATMVGDGIDNNNGYSFDDEVVANNKIDKSIGLGTLDPQLHDLSINVQDTLELDINNTSLLNSEASAVTGDATAKGKMAGNTGIYHANLQAGGAGTIDVSIDSGVNSVAETTTGDSFASAHSLHSVGIESSDFDFQDPHSSLAIKIENNNSASASTKHGSAISHLGSSSAGMLGDTTSDFVRSVESVSALVNDHGFSQAAGISGTGAIATADQSATGIMGYTFTTTSALAMDVTNTVDSQSHAAIVQWG